MRQWPSSLLERRSIVAAALAIAFPALGMLGCSTEPATASIVLSPQAVEAQPGATVQFTATTTGDVGSLYWAVEGTGKGTITQSGLYQAPPGRPSRCRRRPRAGPDGVGTDGTG